MLWEICLKFFKKKCEKKEMNIIGKRSFFVMVGSENFIDSFNIEFKYK